MEWDLPRKLGRSPMLNFLFESLSHADEAIDLSSLGTSDFAPYIFERDSRWILLPALALLAVIIHLKKKKISFKSPLPEKNKEPYENVL